jgi:hypothetical protein
MRLWIGRRPGVPPWSRAGRVSKNRAEKELVLSDFDETEKNKGSGPRDHDFRIPREKSVWRNAPMSKMEQISCDSEEIRVFSIRKGEK